MGIERLDDVPHLAAMLHEPRAVLQSRIVPTLPATEDEQRKMKDLGSQVQRLMHEFQGRTQLEFMHAILIVLIRRRICLRAARDSFFDLWDKVKGFLCDRLTLRWLISACDTICDHPRTTAEATTAITTSALINTANLYETERRMTDILAISEHSLNALQAMRADLFDGLTTFKVGKGDMIRNLVGRLKKAQGTDGSLTASIFFAAADRMLRGDTVFMRFRQLHGNEATRW